MIAHDRHELARPLPLGALVILLVNDHLLKGAGVLPGWLTGKLSDAAGLFAFPILLFALLQTVAPSPRRQRRAGGLALLTILVFAALKLSPPVNRLANAWLGSFVLDPSDVWMCPFALASIVYLRRAPPLEPSRGWTERGALLLAALASMATARPQQGSPYWRVYANATAQGSVRVIRHGYDAPRLFARGLGCAWLIAEVVRSGKEGIGVLVVDDSPTNCSIRLIAARVRIGEVRAAPLALPSWDAERSAYLGFPFDNERLWNQGIRHGVLELEVDGAAHGTLTFDLYHAFNGPHANTPKGDWPVRPPTPGAPPDDAGTADDGAAEAGAAEAGAAEAGAVAE